MKGREGPGTGVGKKMNEGGLDEKVAVRGGVAGAFKGRGLECRKVWTLECSSEKGGGSCHPEEEEGAGACQVSMQNDRDKGWFGYPDEYHVIRWHTVSGEKMS